MPENNCELGEQLAFVMMKKILSLLKESGANRQEAECALRGAEAMLPELQLQVTTSEIET
jgi:hypothetical protein